jgi:hypothetical protein
VGAVQSKATVRAARADRTRLGYGHTPRSKLFPSNQIVLKLQAELLQYCGRCADATDQQPDGAPRLRWLSCARRPTRSYPGYAQLAALDRTRRDAIKGLIERILAAQDTLSKHYLSWAERVSREIAGDQDRLWRHILSATTDHVERIEALLADLGKLDYREATGSQETGIEIHHLIKTKQPKVVVNELGPVREAQIARLFRVIEAYLKGVGREDFVPSPGIQCAACEFFNECRAWR